jgi:hypothetical protein
LRHAGCSSTDHGGGTKGVPLRLGIMLFWSAARPGARAPNRHCGLAIFGLCCRYHRRRCDGRLQGQHDHCECPCVAGSCALVTVPSQQLRQLCDIRRDPPRLILAKLPIVGQAHHRSRRKGVPDRCGHARRSMRLVLRRTRTHDEATAHLFVWIAYCFICGLASGRQF